MIPEILDRKESRVKPDLRDHKAKLDPKDPLDQKVIQVTRGHKDPKVIPEIPGRKDLKVRLDRKEYKEKSDLRDSRGRKDSKEIPEIPGRKDLKAKLDRREFRVKSDHKARLATAFKARSIMGMAPLP
ncbi:hypothetical protein [Robiginitalea sp. SC105]|uniref:hypothetical protein n=1 Tax=Robiginitalea sp. SC105 TaxID=2762332 RepID=UPI001C8E52E7|nr:hypothetical protein [Robiginitalea sp. SC105]